jgi:VWFA-related protein
LHRLRLITLLALLLPTVRLVSQQTTPASPPAATPQKTGRIFLDVAIAPGQSEPVNGLQQQDFTILDNKVARPITSFHAVTSKDVPAVALLVIDAVNTSVADVSSARIEVAKFLRNNGGQLAMPVSLVLFTNSGTSVAPPSRDGNKLADLLNHSVIDFRKNAPNATLEGATERVETSVRTLKQLMAQNALRPGRKLILWVSPGWPLLWAPGSVDLTEQQRTKIFTGVVELSQTMRDGRFTLYAINPLDSSEDVGRTFLYEDFVKGLSKPGAALPGALGLQVLALQSGGLVLHVNRDISAELQQCIADTTAYYGISFDAPPATHLNEYHQIEIEVAKPGLTARARQGYYDQP